LQPEKVYKSCLYFATRSLALSAVWTGCPKPELGIHSSLPYRGL
jgi:hypothetical protein